MKTSKIIFISLGIIVCILAFTKPTKQDFVDYVNIGIGNTEPEISSFRSERKRQLYERKYAKKMDFLLFCVYTVEYYDSDIRRENVRARRRDYTAIAGNFFETGN